MLFVNRFVFLCIEISAKFQFYLAQDFLPVFKFESNFLSATMVTAFDLQLLFFILLLKITFKQHSSKVSHIPLFLLYWKVTSSRECSQFTFLAYELFKFKQCAIFDLNPRHTFNQKIIERIRCQTKPNNLKELPCNIAISLPLFSEVSHWFSEKTESSILQFSVTDRLICLCI